MSNNNTPPIGSIIRYQFSRPSVTNWSYPLMVMSVLTAVFYGIRILANSKACPFPPTSLIGYTFLSVLMTLCVLLLPGFVLSSGITDQVIGRNTGAGSLLLAACSGIPLMMVTTSIYNFTSWIVLRLGSSVIFPAFFYHGGTESKTGMVLSILADTVVPAAGASVFFFGLLWSRFRSRERFVGYIIISCAYMLYSMDFLAAGSLFVTGLWCCFLRTKTGNIFCPFLALVSSRLSVFLFGNALTKIDILKVQTYSDIDSTFFYSSLPALFIGVILISFFMRSLNSFRDAFSDEEEEGIYDKVIPAFDKGLNLTVITAGIILAALWIMIIKGVHI
ncbi:MAG: hypothetical protein K6F49_09645 [Saccharofermentans sp.]|nr:hypothetical protein [Saccharofermentans sp.]